MASRRVIKNLKLFKYLAASATIVFALAHFQLAYAHGSNDSNEMEHGEKKHGEAKHGEAKHSTGHMEQPSDKKMEHGDGHGHGHKLIDVSRWEYVPAISMDIEKDVVSGWNIHLRPDRFKFTPENVNGENIEGEGHAHLFVDEEKVARVYGSWFHLPALTPGRHSIKIQLNANDHSTLAVGDNPIENISIIEQE